MCSFVTRLGILFANNIATIIEYIILFERSEAKLIEMVFRNETRLIKIKCLGLC